MKKTVKNEVTEPEPATKEAAESVLQENAKVDLTVEPIAIQPEEKNDNQKPDEPLPEEESQPPVPPLTELTELAHFPAALARHTSPGSAAPATPATPASLASVADLDPDAPSEQQEDTPPPIPKPKEVPLTVKRKYEDFKKEREAKKNAKKNK